MKTPTKKIAIIATLAFIVAFSACKKDKKSTEPSVLSKTQYLTKAPWKFSMERVKSGGVWTDVTSFLPSCMLDGTITFATNNTVTADEGATKCDPSDPQTISSNWSFFNNEAMLILDVDSATIITLDANTLKYSREDAGDAWEITYTH